VSTDMIDGLGTHSSVACHEPNLSKGILESNVLGGLRISNIRLVIPPAQSQQKLSEKSRNLLCSL
jgi:hypothetical protein